MGELRLAQQATPATPPSGSNSVFVDVADGVPKVVDDAGVVQPFQVGASGQVTVRHFPFAFDLTGLTAGVPVYIPRVDELLLDAWIELVTVWDQAAFADISQYTGSAGVNGMWGDNSGPISLTNAADDINVGGGPANNMEQPGNWPLSGIPQATFGKFSQAAALQQRPVPARFTTVDPLLLVVSQDGTRGGTAPGAGAGAAVLYLVTATPV